MTTANGATPPVPSVTEMRRVARSGVKGTPFDPYSSLRFFGAYSDGAVFDAGFDVRAVDKMLDQDAQSLKNAQTLALPIRSCPWEIKDAPGGKTEGDLARDVLGRLFQPLRDRATNGIWTKKTFHEIEWQLDGSRATIADLHWRPTAACEKRLDPKGNALGFLQRVPGDHPTMRDNPRWPGKVWIEPLRAFVYTHGRHRDPIHGVSDLQVTFNLFEQRQKLKFLLLQFLELQAVPRVLAYGQSDPDAEFNADQLAAATGGGIIPWKAPSDGTKTFDVLEASGTGATMFLETLRWLEHQQSASILADFQSLADQASGNGRGSFAMMSDLRQWFEQNLQAKADELADQVTEQIIRPLTVINFGADAKVPSCSIGPVAQSESDRALDMLTSTLTAAKINIPDGVVDALWIKTSKKLGLDVDEVREAVETWRAEQDEQPEQEPSEDPVGAGSGMRLAHTIEMTYGLVHDALDGVDPQDALNRRLELARHVRTAAGAKRYGRPIGSPISGRRPRTSVARAAAGGSGGSSKSSRGGGDADDSPEGANQGLARAMRQATSTGRRRYLHVGDDGALTVTAHRESLEVGGDHYIVHADGSVFRRGGSDDDEALTALSDTEVHDRIGSLVGDDTIPEGSLADRVSRARKLPDAELQSSMDESIGVENFDAFEALAAEVERRDANRARRAEAKQRDEEKRAARYEQLLDEGVSDETAIEEAYGVSVDKQRKQRAEQLLRQGGYRGGFTAMSRAAFRDEAYQRWLAAEDATNGVLLNALGERKGIDPRSMFMGPESRIRKYASEELRGHLDEAGSLTYDEFMFGLLEGRNSGARQDDFLQ